MSAQPENIMPSRLTLDDQIWDPHAGVEGWRPIVSLARVGDTVVIAVENDPKPLQVPAQVPVHVLRRMGPLGLVAERADAHDESASGADERLSCCYGDLAGLTAAHVEHSYGSVRSNGPAVPHPERLDGWYTGDLGEVPDSEAGVEAQRALQVARAAAMARMLDKHNARGPVVDEADSNDAVAEVEDRLPGWYGGDLSALIGSGN
jgi:hypothetical protein